MVIALLHRRTLGLGLAGIACAGLTGCRPQPKEETRAAVQAETQGSPKIMVRWPDGTTQVLENPQIDRYHQVHRY